MIDSINSLWSLMTIFFSETVIYQPLFMGLILMNVIFYAVYLLFYLLDWNTWGVGKF